MLCQTEQILHIPACPVRMAEYFVGIPGQNNKTCTKSILNRMNDQRQITTRNQTWLVKFWKNQQPANSFCQL